MLNSKLLFCIPVVLGLKDESRVSLGVSILRTIRNLHLDQVLPRYQRSFIHSFGTLLGEKLPQSFIILYIRTASCIIAFAIFSTTLCLV